MAKTILIPIDFRVESLLTLKRALESYADQEINAVLMYAMHLDDSIIDLLFYSPDKIIKSLSTPVFSEARQIITNRFEATLTDLRIKLLHGNNATSFESFLKAAMVDEIFIPKRYTLQIVNKGFDPLPLIKNCDTPVFEIDWQPGRPRQTEQEQLNLLFN